MKRLFLLLLVAAALLYFFSLMALDDVLFTYVASGALHITLFSISMYYLWKKDLASTLESLGFPGTLRDNLLYSIAGLAAIFAALFIFTYLAVALGFNDQEKITEMVADLPLPLLLFAVIAAPFSEELFFRAFLIRTIGEMTTPWAGVLLSSLLFGAVHFAYGSVVEVVGASLIGLVLGTVFLKSRSITPPLIIHITYNLLAVIVMRFLI